MGRRVNIAFWAFLCVSLLWVVCVADDHLATSQWISNESITASLGDQKCHGSMAECGVFEEEEEYYQGGRHGRELWRRRYYISYGALSANRVPCRPRSGRSYYSRNCWGGGPRANPYRRGCSAITRCYRWTG